MKRIYLAGPYGFPDFVSDLDCYEPFRSATASAEPARRGFEISGGLERRVRELGYDPVNPWGKGTVPSQFFAGVVNGVGTDESGAPWSLGSIKDRTLGLADLEHWFRRLNALVPSVELPPFEDYDRAARAYEYAIRRVIYDACVHSATTCDLTFADLNDYRGNVDNGTFLEAIKAADAGKQVIVLLDTTSATGEGDSPVPLMVEGWIHDTRSPVITGFESFFRYLERGEDPAVLELHPYFRPVHAARAQTGRGPSR